MADVQELRADLQRVSEHARALVLESDDESFKAFYALISDVTDVLLHRCPAFASSGASDTERFLEQQEGPTEAEQSEVQKAVKGSTGRPLPSPFPPEA